MKNFILFLAALSVYATGGDQVLHTYSTNRPYERNADYVNFVQNVMKNPKALGTDAEMLHYASDAVTVDGLFLELGTGMGRSTNFLAALNPYKTIYTFDSYLGHPADWDKGDHIIPKDFFAWPSGMPLPRFLLNVKLTQGWFIDTLPTFVSLNDQPIAFLHIDCEIYESSAQGLDLLGPMIVDGTIILFDELYNYPNFLNHEYKALQEFLQAYGCEAEYIAYNPNHEQVAIRIHKP